MKFSTKILLGQLGIVLVLGSVALGAIQTGASQLRRQIQGHSLELVRQIACEIEQHLQYRIDDLSATADTLDLTVAAADSNRRYADMPEPRAFIARVDQTWRDGDSPPFIRDLLHSDLSVRLARRVDFYRRIRPVPAFGELFLTNAQGALVATSQRTSDFYQADEVWFQQAARAEHAWLGTVEYDRSAGLLSVDLVVNLRDAAGRHQGLLKGVYNLGEIAGKTSEITARFPSRSVRAWLVDRDGFLIFSNRDPRLDPGDRDIPLRSFGTDLSGREAVRRALAGEQGLLTGQEGERSLVTSFVPLQADGKAARPQLGWALVVDVDARELMAPVQDMSRLLYLVLALVLALSLFAAWRHAGALVAPLERLRAAAQAVGRGRLDTRVGLDGSDELADLGREFDRMAAALRASSISRSELAREVEARTEDLSHFFEIAAHDLHEPVRRAQVFAGRLQRRLAASPESRDSDDLARLLRAMQRMDGQIDALRRYADVLNRELRIETVDLNRLVGQVLAQLSLPAGDDAIELDVAPLQPVQGDPGLLALLFRHLLENACKFRRQGVAHRVRVYGERLSPEEPGVAGYRVAIEDNGIGFDEQFSHKLTRLFRRLHQGDAPIGIGLGVAMAARIAERLGGGLQAQGRPGAGAAFSVVLPLAQEIHRASPETPDIGE